MTSDLAAATEHFRRDPGTPAIAVADGYGLRITVHRGHLVIDDGIGQHRRQRRYSRADRTLHRLVILGDTGYITLGAIRWCADLGIAVIHVDREARLLSVTGDPGIDDPRLRRAQAAAASNPVGIHITHELLGAKLNGQATVAAEQLNVHGVSALIRDLADQLPVCEDLAQCRAIEAKASNAYFGAWTAHAQCQFAQRDVDRVPAHWLTFSSRGSPLHKGGRSPRSAADPINALLNYGYTLAAAECRLATLALGLDPGLGIVHTDKRDRDSLALDLLEPLRPVVERHILQLLATRYLRSTDFHETRHGVCRLLAPLTHELAQWMSSYAQTVAHHAETVAHAIARSSPGDIALRTPLSRHNTKAGQSLGQRLTTRKPVTDPKISRSCRTCGTALDDPSRQLCAACWPVIRHTLALQRTAKGNKALAAARAAGHDPSNTPSASRKRSNALSQRRREELDWQSANDDVWTADRYTTEIQPLLQELPLSALQAATGLSLSACSKIRAGTLLPHRRHWARLGALVAPG